MEFKIVVEHSKFPNGKHSTIIDLICPNTDNQIISFHIMSQTECNDTIPVLTNLEEAYKKGIQCPWCKEQHGNASSTRRLIEENLLGAKP